MKRTPRLVLAMSLIALVSMFVANLASAHTITVDFTTGEWFSKSLLPRENTGHILRNASGQGEFAWRDRYAGQNKSTPIGDQRITGASAITRSVDLVQFRVTGDATNLYLLAETEYIPLGTAGSSLPQFQIAIDTAGGGAQTLIDPSSGKTISTTVSPNASWEYLVQTQFQSGLSTAPKLWTGATGTPAGGSAAGSAQLVLTPSNTAEISIPWASLGGKPAASDRWRFTVAVMYTNGNIPADGASSRVLDAVSSASSTLSEVNDGDIDSYSDIHFDANGEPFAPLVVSEIAPNPAGSNAQTQWIEIANGSTDPVSLSGYKVGDETGRGGNSSEDGMYSLPNITLQPGEVVLAVRSKIGFSGLGYTLPGGFSNARILEIGTDLPQYTSWSSGNFNLKDQPVTGKPFSDEVLILDASDTIVDLVQWGSTGASVYPGVSPISVPSTGIPFDASNDWTFQRCPVTRDTNDQALDFVTSIARADHTPGASCGTSTTDLSLVKTGPSVTQEGSTVQYVIHYANNAANAVGATNVVITDTLPTGFTNYSEASTPQLQASTGTATRTWTLPTLNAGKSGLITVTLTLPFLPLGNQTGAATNSAGISIAQGATVTDVNPANDLSQVDTTITKAPQTDVQVSISLLNAQQAYPTGQAIYQISYANTGDLAAAGTTIAQTIPAGLSYSSNTGSFVTTPGAGTISFALGTLTPGASGTFNAVFNVNANATVGGTLVSQATIQTTTVPEFNTGNNTGSSQAATIASQPAIDLSITKTAGAAAVGPNGVLRYTITVKNNAGALNSATGVIVTDSLPPGLTYRTGSSTGGAGEPAVNGNTLTWSLPAAFTLAPGAAAKAFSFDVNVSGAQIGDSFTNTAAISGGGSSEPGSALSDNSATSGTTKVSVYSIYLSLIKR